MPQLDEFGDIDDADTVKKNQLRIKRSIDLTKKRQVVNVEVKDVTHHRLNKDIFAQSVSSGGASPKKVDKGHSRLANAI